MKESEEKLKRKRKKREADQTTPDPSCSGGEKEHRKPWQETYATVEEIKTFLADRIFLRHNTVTRRTECRLPSGWKVEGGAWKENTPDTDQWQPLSDRVVNSLWAEMSKDRPVRVQDMWRVMESDYAPEYHPFRFYLEHLPPWNHQDDYILEMSVSVSVKGGVDEQLRFAACLRKWLVAMVAGWLDEREVNHEILIFVGEQGIYKTTWFNYVLPPELRNYFYTKTNAGRMTKDDLLTLAQYGLVCWEERKHIASFCGTGNNLQFLSDATGTRRWLPFEVEQIESPRDKPFNYEDIYSQAYALYREGFQYWFTPTEIRQLSQHNSLFETPRLETELVQLYFRQPTEAEQGEFISVARAMQLISANISQKLSAVYLGRALAELGFRRVKYKGVRGYIVVCRKADEIQMVQRSMARDACAEGWTVDSSGQHF